ncbi:MAG: alpha/beta fold hydrolase [Nitratireductor sp.]
MNFVLVHGGWHGGWCWREVEKRLQAGGHRVFAPSLTGLAERSHLIHAVAGPDTHVEDIVRIIEFNSLSDVILVGHSYGGMVITGVASRLTDHIAALVYLDAFVPTENHMAANRMANPERVREIEKAIQSDGTILPTGFERWVTSEENIRWLEKMCTPHPANCFSNGVTLSGNEDRISRRHFILCEHHKPSPFWQFYDRYKEDPTWHVSTLPCLHDAMIEMPQEVTDIILEASKLMALPQYSPHFRRPATRRLLRLRRSQSGRRRIWINWQARVRGSLPASRRLWCASRRVHQF